MDSEEELHIGLLARICRLHHAAAHRMFQAAGLYRGQPPLLDLLWTRQGRTHTELARALNVTPATVTKMVQRMESTGFVVRKPDPTDERISRVYLTEKGVAVESWVRDSFRRFEDRVMAGFSEKETAEIDGYLARIYANLVEIDGKERDQHRGVHTKHEP